MTHASRPQGAIERRVNQSQIAAPPFGPFVFSANTAEICLLSANRADCVAFRQQVKLLIQYVVVTVH